MNRHSGLWIGAGIAVLIIAGAALVLLAVLWPPIGPSGGSGAGRQPAVNGPVATPVNRAVVTPDAGTNTGGTNADNAATQTAPSPPPDAPDTGKPVPADPEVNAPRTVRVRIVNDQQQPIAGAHVHATVDVPGRDANESASATTPADGTVTFTLPGGFGWTVTVVAAGYLDATADFNHADVIDYETWETRVVPPQNPGQPDEHTIVLRPGISQVVEVVDSNGRPVEGASLDVMVVGDDPFGFPRADYSTDFRCVGRKTDAAGRATLSLASRDKEYMLTADPPEGRPLTGASVAFEASDQPLRVQLAITGTLEVTWRPASPLRFLPKLPVMVEVRYPVPTDGTLPQVVVTAPEGLPDPPRNRHLGGDRWTEMTRGGQSFVVHAVALGRPGEVTTVRGLPPGPVQIGARPDGLLPLAENVRLDLGVDAVARADLVLDAGLTLVAHLLGPEGPLPGLTVKVNNDYETHTTNAAGDLRLGGLSGPVTLTVPSAGYSETIDPAATPEVTIEFPAELAYVVGRVTGHDRQPVRVAVVALAADAPADAEHENALGRTETAEDGSYCLVATAGPDALLVVTETAEDSPTMWSGPERQPRMEAGWIPAPVAVRLHPGVTRRDIRLAQLVTVSGRVMRSDGAAVPDGTITSGMPLVLFCAGAYRGMIKDGEYTIDLPPGRHPMRATSSGTGDDWSKRFPQGVGELVVPDRVAEFRADLVLDPPPAEAPKGTLRVELVVGRGNPQHAMLWLGSASAGGWSGTTANSDNNMEWDDLAPGDYTLRIGDLETPLHEETITIGEGGGEIVRRIELPHVPNRASVRGRVLDETGEPLVGASIHWAGSRFSAFNQTNRKGQFALRDTLPAGRHLVGLSLGGILLLPLFEVVVPDDPSVTEVEVEFRVTGRMEDGGARLLGVAPDGPAARAGLKPGDILRAIEDEPIQQDWQVRREVKKAFEARDAAGETGPVQLRVRVWRAGSTFDALVIVSDPDNPLAAELEG